MSAHPAELRTLHLAMLDAVLVGEGLGTVADLAAAECGGPVVLIVPRLEVLAPSADVRAEDLPELRRYVLERCRGRVAPVPAGVAAEVPIATGAELLGAVLLLGDAPAGERALERLRLVSVAALTEIALAHARDVPGRGRVGDAALRPRRRRGARARGDRPPRGPRRLRPARRRGRGGLRAARRAPAPRRRARARRLARSARPARHRRRGRRAPAARRAAAAAHRAVRTPRRPRRRWPQRLARHGPVGLTAPCEDPAELGAAVESAGLAIDLATEERPVAARRPRARCASTTR